MNDLSPCRALQYSYETPKDVESLIIALKGYYVTGLASFTSLHYATFSQSRNQHMDMGQTAQIQETRLSQSAIRELVAPDLKLVDQTILERLKSDVVLINQLGNYIINSGGKRLRPLLALLAAKACEYQDDAHIQVAAIVEFIHTATLLHDDVVDAEYKVEDEAK